MIGKRRKGRQKKGLEYNLKSGQEWRQLKTEQDGKGLLLSHLWRPNDLERLLDRLEQSW